MTRASEQPRTRFSSLQQQMFACCPPGKPSDRTPAPATSPRFATQVEPDTHAFDIDPAAAMYPRHVLPLPLRHDVVLVTLAANFGGIARGGTDAARLRCGRHTPTAIPRQGCHGRTHIQISEQDSGVVISRLTAESLRAVLPSLTFFRPHRLYA